MFFCRRELPFLMNKIFFWLSLLYMIYRTVCVLYFASNINDESRKPLVYLRGVPTAVWSVEVNCSKRLSDERRFENGNSSIAGSTFHRFGSKRSSRFIGKTIFLFDQKTYFRGNYYNRAIFMFKDHYYVKHRFKFSLTDGRNDCDI